MPKRLSPRSQYSTREAGAKTFKKVFELGPEVRIPSPARERIIELLREGAEITSLTYKNPSSNENGQLFFNKDAERAWKVFSP